METRSCPHGLSTPGSRILDALLNLLYPADCLVCRAPVAFRRERGVCGRCRAKVLELAIEPPWCPLCGLPYRAFAAGEAHLCGDCLLEPPPFSGARSFGYYTGELRRLVHALKFEGRRDLVHLAAPLLAEVCHDSWGRGAIDAIVAIPLHRSRQRERGFNQAALLARALSDRLDVPFRDVLERTRRTPPQVGLTARERRRNVRGAFRVRPDRNVAQARLLLIDDVVTTGATAASAASALLDAGALRVSVVSLARAVEGFG